MKRSENMAGGILRLQRSPSGKRNYYLIRSLPAGEAEACYSLFCSEGESAAFFFDVCRSEGRALELLELLSAGEVSPACLEEVLEEL